MLFRSQFVDENGLEGKFIATGLELTADAFNRVLDGDLMATSSVDSVLLAATAL